MRKVIARANSKLSVGVAASIISASFFASALLGLLRDRLLAARFGIDSGILDAYWAAFSLPDLLYFFLVSGALSVTFIPVIKERLVRNDKLGAWEMSSSLINFLATITLAVSILLFIFADPLIGLIASGFEQPRHELAVVLMRIIAINPFIFTISTILGSMQQAVNRFFFFAAAPVLYNVGIIIGILTLSPHYGIVGVALGVALGALMQLLITIIGMTGMGFEYDWKINWGNPGFRRVLKLLVPRSIDQGMDNLNATVERFIASFLAIGSITAYQYAFTLRNVPVMLIGVAISTAAFPSITERAASTRTDLFKKELLGVMRLILWFAVPAAAIAFIMRGYLVRLLVGQGNATISDLLGWFAISIIFRAIFHALSRAFYAQQDTKTPLMVSIATVGLNIVLAFMLVTGWNDNIVGLAAAQSIVSIVEVIILIVILERRLGGLIDKNFVWSSLKTTVATVMMSVVTYLMVSKVFPLFAMDVGFFTLAPKFVGMVAASGVAYLAASYILKMEEARTVASEIRKRIFRPIVPSKL